MKYYIAIIIYALLAGTASAGLAVNTVHMTGYSISHANPASPTSPLHPMNQKKSSYEKRKVFIYQVSGARSGHKCKNKAWITLYDYKDKQVYTQRGCRAFDKHLKHQVIIDKNVTRDYYLLNC